MRLPALAPTFSLTFCDGGRKLRDWYFAAVAQRAGTEGFSLDRNERSNGGVYKKTKIALAAARSAVTLIAFHASYRRERVRHSRDARLDTYAPAQDRLPVSVVRPANYKYRREACCFSFSPSRCSRHPRLHHQPARASATPSAHSANSVRVCTASRAPASSLNVTASGPISSSISAR